LDCLLPHNVRSPVTVEYHRSSHYVKNSQLIPSQSAFLLCIGLSSAVKCYECYSVYHTNGGCGKEDFKSSASIEKDDCKYCQVFSVLLSLLDSVNTFVHCW